MGLEAVFFDLGGTLIRHFEPGYDYFAHQRTGTLALYDFLIERGYGGLPPRDEFAEAFDKGYWAASLAATRGECNACMPELIEAGCRAFGIELGTALPEAERRVMEALQAGRRLMEGATETVAALQARGFRLAAISNAAWRGKFIRDDLIRLGLIDAFEFVLVSCDEGLWKPGPAIFQRALDRMGLRPEQAIYVGDYVRYDVVGAHAAGMRGVWLNVWNREPDADEPPDAEIHDLRELIGLAEAWRKSDAARN
jgi:HAD superfamily hydrolase (TIGR01509 family)